MSIESVTCPNCGATGIDLTAEYVKCEHCGSTLRTKDAAAHNAAAKETRAQKAQRNKRRARRLLGIALGIPLALLSLAVLAWFAAACAEDLRSPENTLEAVTGVTMWVIILITGVPGALLLRGAFGKGGKRRK